MFAQTAESERFPYDRARVVQANPVKIKKLFVLQNANRYTYYLCYRALGHCTFNTLYSMRVNIQS